MKLQNSLTIRWHLLWLLLALALPFAAFLMISTARQATQDRELAGQQMLGVARLTAARLDDHIGDIHQLLSVLSVIAGPEPGDAASNDALLASLSDHLPQQVNNLSVWTAKGTNIGTLIPKLRLSGINVAGRKFFREAMTGGGALGIEAPVASVSNGQMVGIFALPIERHGQVVGVVAVSAQLRQLQTLLAPDGSIAPGGVISVTDAEGVVLARSIDPDKWIGRNLTNVKTSGVTQSRARRDGVRDGPSADGITRIAGFTTARSVPWLVYVGIPAEVAMAPVRRRLYENIAAGGAMMVIGLLLAMWVGRSISSPLRQLRSDAAAIESGDLAHRSTVHRGGEIGALASTLNSMAEALQQRKRLLEESQERLRQLAEHDTLTGLPNRALFLDRLNQGIARAATEGSALALLFLDIDHFKAVNDTLGHAAGDEVLRAFSRRLLRSVRSGDTVARLAGDEFTVILDGMAHEDDAHHIAQTLVEKARRTVGSEGGAAGGGSGKTVAISSSIGVAILAPGETASELLRRADIALYDAKRAGRDRYCFSGGADPAAGTGDLRHAPPPAPAPGPAPLPAPL